MELQINDFNGLRTNSLSYFEKNKVSVIDHIQLLIHSWFVSMKFRTTSVKFESLAAKSKIPEQQNEDDDDFGIANWLDNCNRWYRINYGLDTILGMCEKLDFDQTNEQHIIVTDRMIEYINSINYVSVKLNEIRYMYVGAMDKLLFNVERIWKRLEIEYKLLSI